MNGKITIEVRDSLAAISASQWNALCDDGNPFLRHEFLHTLDETGCLGQATGWYPRYFLLWGGNPDSSDLLGAVATYVKTNSYGEFVFDWAWAEAYERHNEAYYPKLVASIPFTPATGRRLLVRADQPMDQYVRLLASAVRQFADAEEYSGVHFLFITEAEGQILFDNSDSDSDSDSHDSAGDVPEDAESDNDKQARDLLSRIDCQYHWHNEKYQSFDDFLARCTAKRRKTIRRERRHVSDANLRLEQRLGNTLTEAEWSWVHDFYQSTFDRKWGNPSLTQKFFQTIGQRMGEQVLIVFAYDEQDANPEWPVACSIMFIGRSTLYGRFWGCRREFNSLHFEACYYQGIEYCIAHEIENFEPGAQGEHKITRGFIPTITRSAHHIRHPGFRDAIANFLDQERPHVEQRCTGLSDLLPFKASTFSL